MQKGFSPASEADFKSSPIGNPQTTSMQPLAHATANPGTRVEHREWFVAHMEFCLMLSPRQSFKEKLMQSTEGNQSKAEAQQAGGESCSLSRSQFVTNTLPTEPWLKCNDTNYMAVNRTVSVARGQCTAQK